MPNLVVVTNLLPHYQIDFFNRLVELEPGLNLTVIADIECDTQLNNYADIHCNFNVVHSEMKSFRGLIFRGPLKKKIDSLNSDFLVFYGNPREVSLSILMLVYKLLGKKFYVHGMFHRIGGQTIISRTFYRFVGILADKCFVYSRKGAEVLLGLGVDYKKLRVIGTAINEQRSIQLSGSITETDVLNFKKEKNLENKKVVLQVVRLSKIKKPGLIIDVAVRLKKVRKDIVFVLIGGGELFDDLQARVKANDLEDTVRLLGAIYDDRLLAYWFKSSSVFVIPTCIGLSAHHAFSYGLPIVTDDDLLNQASEFDILVDGLNSIIYKSGDIGSFERSILSVIDDEDLRSLLSKNALHTVKYVNSLDAKCNRYLCEIS